MAAPSTTPRRLTDTEFFWAFFAGGGLTLMIVAFFLAAMRGEPVGLIPLMMFVGILLLVGGTVGWIISTQPWKGFDDLTTPLYTGHHDDHAVTHTRQAHTPSHSEEEADEARFTTGRPYLEDDLVQSEHVEVMDTDPAVSAEETAVDLPTPPVIMDPMIAFPPAPEPAPEPTPQIEPHPMEVDVEHPTKAIGLAPVSAAPPKADDLLLIKGIGPKITAALHAAGIHTFAQLVQKSPAELSKIVVDGGVKATVRPENWITDAKKVLAGDASALQTPGEARFDKAPLDP